MSMIHHLLWSHGARVGSARSSRSARRRPGCGRRRENRPREQVASDGPLSDSTVDLHADGPQARATADATARPSATDARPMRPQQWWIIDIGTSFWENR